MKKLFTSDTHFGHKNIIDYCNRPFDTTEEMDEKLIENWNSKVDPGDLVYHLGDVAMTFESAEKVIPRLNGNIYLIAGNHDQRFIERYKKMFVDVRDTKVVKLRDGHSVFLSHYSHRSWPGQFRGRFHLFGHDHDTMKPYEKSFDIGVDSHNYYPLTEEEVISIMETL